ncbi:hypothetical protein GCM10009682_20610 [Luedemannella flava]|uniref:Amidohydrolase n=1 Tax=Luedemannella flava TaxID=349316 RepID=A0ABN2LTD7_9ACTN
MIIDAHHHLWTADYAWLADPARTAGLGEVAAARLDEHRALHAGGAQVAAQVDDGVVAPDPDVFAGTAARTYRLGTLA